MESARRHPDSARSVTLMNGGSQVMKTIQALTAALCLALMATGCAVTEMRSVTKTADSGFLGKDASLLTPGDISKGQVGLRYFNPSAQWRQYTRIIIEPVTFWGDDTTKVKPPDQQALATYFRGALEKEFAQQFEIVTTPAPDVVRLQVAITDAEAADRKSTRLNSSHGYISYAVFCLKKKQ